jgi:hypothetical protein
VPALTTATQYSGLPFPEPIRTSNGFRVIGNWGKIRTHILPVFSKHLAKTTRAASICFAVIQLPVVAINP